MTNPTSRIQVLTSPDGTKIWAESAGDPSKPAIVFVHGLSCTALGWDAQSGCHGPLGVDQRSSL